ncbi:MAG TPA: nucleoside triphosphate pyrophosphohydrolase [Thermomicrobiales bacterium]|jgi:predicted house-cleaning noncanonical NTP pyrophosphatase (MazG superfamily)|nr:nucleoside triphosphate pyrophosphohydrolase [Thermomicrobiales bacterium]
MRHDKLVRDRIPEIIRAAGETPITRTLSIDEHVPALRTKLTEEVAEYLADADVRELADVLEVMRALVAAHGLTWDELESIRAAKRAERGGFDDGVFLTGTR